MSSKSRNKLQCLFSLMHNKVVIMGPAAAITAETTSCSVQFSSCQHKLKGKTPLQSKHKTSYADSQTNLDHTHKAPDYNHEATQPLLDLPTRG